MFLRDQDENSGEDGRNQHAAEKALHHAGRDQDVEAAGKRASPACRNKTKRGACEQKAQRQGAGENAGEWNRDHLGHQIGRLNPAQLRKRNVKRRLDGRKRRGHDLDVQHRHEHAQAHGGEAQPERPAFHAANFSIP